MANFNDARQYSDELYSYLLINYFSSIYAYPNYFQLLLTLNTAKLLIFDVPKLKVSIGLIAFLPK